MNITFHNNAWQTCTIAILLPKSSFNKEVHEGMMAEFQRNKLLNVRSHTYKLSPTESVEEIAHMLAKSMKRGCKIIMSIGPEITYKTRQAMTSLQVDLPLIFVGTPHDEDLIQLQKEKKSPLIFNNITGIFSAYGNYKKQIELLKTVNPKINTILMMYNKRDYFVEKQVVDLQKALNQYAIKVKLLPTKSGQEMITGCAKNIVDADCLITVQDWMADEQEPALSKICREQKKIYYSSYLASSLRDASLAYGHHGKVYGELAVGLAFQVHNNNLDARRIPMLHPKSIYFFSINQQALKIIGIIPDIKRLHKMCSLHIT